MSNQWKDITTYSRSVTERIPSTFEARSGDLRITITSAHISYKGDWVMHCYALGIDTLHLKTCTTKTEAQKRALEVVRMKLNRLVTDLDALQQEITV